MTDREYLGTDEVAGLIGRSPETLRYWRHRGEGPASFKLGRRVVYRESAVREWVAEQEAKTTTATVRTA